MKPQLLKLSYDNAHSFNARQDMTANINNRWHYHAEIELIHFHKGGGTQFVGDRITRFRPDDIVMVGSNLPHYWKYDEGKPDDSEDEKPYSTVIHFYKDFWSSAFLDLPENKLIKATLERASRGIQITDGRKTLIGGIMHKLLTAEGPRRITQLIECIIEVGSVKSNPLSSIAYKHNLVEADNDRINLIYDYSFANYKDKILLESVAGIANLSAGSFCRYFKLKTGKTYSQFITEVRIGIACKLLLEETMTVKQICFECGFNNFSSFHDSFKLITNKTPLNYKKGLLMGNYG